MSLTKATYSMIEGSAINILDYGADASGVLDSTNSILLAAQAAVASGAKLVVPAGEYVVNELELPQNTYLCGEGTQIGTGYLTSVPAAVFKCTTGTFCISSPQAPTYPGYRIENLVIVGWSGAAYGLKATGTSGWLHNLVIKGVTNGVGVRYSKAWRGGVDSVYISECAVGLLLGYDSDAVNGTTFTNVCIETCRAGVYSYAVSNPQIGNVFNSIIVEGCGLKYQSGTWPADLTPSADFTTATGMNSSTIEGGIILEKNFYATFNGLYLEVNSGIYLFQGSTGYLEANGGIIEMTEPANDYAGSPIILAFSPAKTSGVRLTWDDSKTSAIVSISSNKDSDLSWIFNTSGTSRSLYYDVLLSSSVIRPASYRLKLRNSNYLQKADSVNIQGIVYSVGTTGSLRIPCQSGTTFLFNGLTGNINLDADYATDGQVINCIFIQDGVGGRTITFAGSTFVNSWTNTGNTANKVSSVQFVYSSSIGKFIQIGATNTWM